MRKTYLMKGFRYIRWVFESSNSNCGATHYFAASALDVYGTLSNKKFLLKGVSCRKARKTSILNIIFINIVMNT